jgi:hypothetical protein
VLPTVEKLQRQALSRRRSPRRQDDSLRSFERRGERAKPSALSPYLRVVAGCQEAGTVRICRMTSVAGRLLAPEYGRHVMQAPHEPVKASQGRRDVACQYCSPLDWTGLIDRWIQPMTPMESLAPPERSLPNRSP